MLNLIIKFAIFSFLNILVYAGEPYCIKNETTIVRIPIKKTRQVIKKPTGVFKVFKKTKYYIETYDDYEEQQYVKPIRVCCEGYKMSDLNICEPNCEKGCPKHANCIETNICQCAQGFAAAVSVKDGSHRCEPICLGDCPQYARCAAPNICECEVGYQKTPDDLCEPRNDIKVTDTSDISTTTDMNFVNEDESDLDENEKIFLPTSAPDAIDYTDYTDSTPIDCPPNFFFFGNTCRPKIFSSNEVDCSIKPCVDEHAFCRENGTCACKEGYLWYKPIKSLMATDAEVEVEAEIEPVCLPAAEVNALMGSIERSDIDDEDDIDWISGSLIALGVVCMMCALCFLVFRLMRREKGKMDVEAKNDLCCSYDNKNYNESPSVY